MQSQELSCRGGRPDRPSIEKTSVKLNVVQFLRFRTASRQPIIAFPGYEMKKETKRSVLRRIGHRVACLLAILLRILSSIRLWFLLTIISYVTITIHHLLEMRFARQEWSGEFYSVASSFLIGALISFLFYFLVVYIPERKRRRIIKENLRKFYAGVKQDIMYQVIFASQKGGRADLSADSETVERLLTIDGFKAAFAVDREGDEGFYAFRNYIGNDGPEYREIILNLQLLSKQIEYALHNYKILDEKIFEFFKRLDALLFRLERIGPGYDEEKHLSRFIYEIFGGFSWVEGYRGYDIVDRMIEDI
jgi:hypothetical protein